MLTRLLDAPLWALTIVISMLVLWIPALCVGVDWLAGRIAKRRVNDQVD